MWHSELTLQVTCCNTVTRTSPAHRSPSSAVRQLPPISQPAPNGSARDRTHRAGNAAEIARMERSAVMSGAYRSGGVGSSRSSQPAWAWARPRSCPAREGVMAAVHGDPADDRALEAHRPRERERDTQGRGRGEAAVGQQPVEADGDAEPGDHVETHRK